MLHMITVLMIKITKNVHSQNYLAFDYEQAAIPSTINRFDFLLHINATCKLVFQRANVRKQPGALVTDILCCEQ